MYDDVAVGNEQLLMNVLRRQFGRDNVRGGVASQVVLPPWIEDVLNIEDAQHNWKCWGCNAELGAHALRRHVVVL